MAHLGPTSKVGFGHPAFSFPQQGQRVVEGQETKKSSLPLGAQADLGP